MNLYKQTFLQRPVYSNHWSCETCWSIWDFQRDQTQLHPTPDPLAARISDYKHQHHSINPPNDQQPDKCTCPCGGCGSYSHCQRGQKDHSTKCPAWGKQCQKCKILSHFACVCCQKNISDQANALIAGLNQETPQTNSNNHNSTA